jgi:hypothetical protein
MGIAYDCGFNSKAAFYRAMTQRYINRFGAIGLSHRIIVGRNTYLNTVFSADGMRYTFDKREYSLDMRMLPVIYSQSTEGKYSFRSTLNHKIMFITPGLLSLLGYQWQKIGLDFFK